MSYNETIKNIPFIPYFETSRYRVDTMVELSQVKPGEKVADLGSGDGRIALAFGKVGALVTGFELDLKLVTISQGFVQEQNLDSNVTIKQEDFWNTNLSGFDIITVYPMPDVMLALEQKLQKELKKGTRILTNYYPFPNWMHWATKDKIYMYIK